ncbi:hypothetical protein ACFFOE_000141 [Klebsiella aerogenes]
MSGKDFNIKSTLEAILQNDAIGKNLKIYFENTPEKDTRRVISILSMIYPDKINMSDNEFEFIVYMFSSEKNIRQENFFEFVRAVSLINFTDKQKNIFIDAIKKHMELLCEKCTFELDILLMKIFEPPELIKYIYTLIGNSAQPVMRHVEYILKDELFCHNANTTNILELLKQQSYK